MQSHPSTLVSRSYAGRRVCRPVINHRHLRAVRQIALVHAASLRASQLVAREAPLTKQETPGTAIPEASTAHPVADTEVRAAGAQSDTRL